MGVNIWLIVMAIPLTLTNSFSLSILFFFFYHAPVTIIFFITCKTILSITNLDKSWLWFPWTYSLAVQNFWGEGDHVTVLTDTTMNVFLHVFFLSPVQKRCFSSLKNHIIAYALSIESSSSFSTQVFFSLAHEQNKQDSSIKSCLPLVTTKNYYFFQENFEVFTILLHF